MIMLILVEHISMTALPCLAKCAVLQNIGTALGNDEISLHVTPYVLSGNEFSHHNCS